MFSFHNPVASLLRPFYASKSRPWEEGRKDCEKCIKTALRLSLAACEFFILRQVHALGNQVTTAGELSIIVFLWAVDVRSFAYMMVFDTASDFLPFLRPPLSIFQIARIIMCITYCALTAMYKGHSQGILAGRIDRVSLKASDHLASFCGYQR